MYTLKVINGSVELTVKPHTERTNKKPQNVEIKWMEIMIIVIIVIKVIKW